MRVNNDELRDADLGDIPLLVIASSDTLATFPDWIGGQRYEAARSRNGKLIVAEGSHHMIQWDQPQTVTAAIQEVIVSTHVPQRHAFCVDRDNMRHMDSSTGFASL